MKLVIKNLKGEFYDLEVTEDITVNDLKEKVRTFPGK
jgi:hypothetical protein